jgi:hypothetical protein
LKPEQRDYALKIAEQALAHRNEDTPLPETFPEELKDETEDWCFETEADGNDLWLHSQDGGIEAACAFIQHLLQKFEFAGAVTFEWSHDCTRPRTDAYGGGAAYITSSEIETFSTSEWLRKMVHG